MNSRQILLDIQTNDSPNITERRFPGDISIVDLKSRLEIITGASSATMNLTFYDASGGLISTADDSKCLGDYLISENDQRLQLRVKDFNAVKLDDLSSVPKFEISDEDYDKRSDSVRAFKMRNKLGQYSDKSPSNEHDAGNIKIGDRCQVTLKNVPPRRGQVMYVGKIADKQGHFIGVRYDEPYGKNDGTFEGVRYSYYFQPIQTN